MLILVYVLNFLSRQLPGILAKPIQDSLHISDGQLGRIGGLYFALFYCCISIPVGWLADKTNRSKVLALACAIWSAATMCCGGACQLSAICHRVHDGRLWRSRRRSTLLLDHLRLFSARPSRSERWASTTSDRRLARRWGSPLALPSPPLSAGATHLSGSARLGLSQ